MTTERDPIADLLAEDVLQDREPGGRPPWMVVVGAIGAVSVITLGVIWLTGGSDVAGTTTTAVAGETSSTTTTTIPVVPATDERVRAAGASGDGLLILFGGESETHREVLADAAVSRDAGSSWSLLSWLDGPAARVGATLSHAPTSDSYFLFGGTETNFSMACPPSCVTLRPLADLWSYDPQSDAWTEIFTDEAGPPVRAGHAAAFDSLTNSLVVFGGVSRGEGDRPTDTEVRDDTWVYDAGDRRWVRVGGNDGPPGLVFAQMVHHPATGRIYLWGGRTEARDDADDAVWAFDSVTYEWERIPPPENAPTARWFHQMTTLDDGRLLVTGGTWLQSRQLGSGTTSEILPTDEVWLWDPATNAWSAGPALPSPTTLHTTVATDTGAIVTYGATSLLLDTTANPMVWVELGR